MRCVQQWIGVAVGRMCKTNAFLGAIGNRSMILRGGMSKSFVFSPNCLSIASKRFKLVGELPAATTTEPYLGKRYLLYPLLLSSLSFLSPLSLFPND